MKIVNSKIAENGQVRLSNVRLSYAHLFEPYASEPSQDEKYSVCLLIPKKDKEAVSVIEQAIEKVKQEGKAKWGGKIPAKLKLPLRDGDEERPDDENYAGHYFINANAKRKPDVRNQMNIQTANEEEVYSGCYAYAFINFFPFDSNGNRGIGAGLNGIIKIADGDKLSGAPSIDSMLDDMDFDDELDDMLG